MRGDDTQEDGCPADEVITTSASRPLAHVLAHAATCTTCMGKLEHARTAAGVDDDDAPLEAMPLERGATVGRYVIERAVGEGGMGVVFEGYDRELQRKVAIKLLSPRTTSASRTWQERLLREARAMAKVSHPNVVPIYDLGAHGRQVFIAMELVEGLTLRDWLAAKPHAWAEVVEVFRQIGRGLAAAHDAGLVHRDVKPSNILIGNDGRARLTDFGVVKQVGDAHQVAAGGKPQPELGHELTRIGAIVGTIPYMAPEQLEGHAADPRTDQFSLCVAFYEALYRENPCAMRDPGQLDRWRIPDAPDGTRVPAWVRRVVVRGMSPNPDQRYVSIHALLADLGGEPGGFRPIPLIAVAIVAGCAFAWYFAGGSSGPACAEETARLDKIWDAPTKRAIREAFAATKKPYAEASYASVERALDAYTTSWLRAQRESCELGDRDEPRRDCLGSRLDDLRAQTELLARADGRTVELAVTAVTSLPDPAECARAALVANVRPSPRARDLRVQLANAKAMEDLGKYPDGIAIARAVVEAARAIPDRALEAEAHYQLGELLRRKGDAADAAAALEQATLAAVAGRHDEVAARAWIRLAYVVGVDRAQYAEGLRIAEHARAFIERLGGDKRLEAMLAGDLSILYRKIGKYDDSVAQSDRALALGEQIWGPAHSQLASWLNSSGLTLLERGQYADARARFQRALAIWEKEFGPHPKVASAYGNLGLERFRSGDYEQAAILAKRALDINEREVGHDSPKLTSNLTLVGSSYSELGRHDDGIAALRRAVLLTESLPAHHPSRLGAVVSLGIAYQRASNPTSALPLLEQSLATMEARADPSDDPADLAETRFALAETLAALGNTKRARELAITARAGFAASGPKMKRQLAEVDVWLAK